MVMSDDEVFTEHVRTLDRGTTEIPTAVKGKLSDRLRRKLRKRGLLYCAASTFGYAGKRLGDADVFDELLMDAYLHLFFGLGANAGKQLEYLRRQVAAGNQIDRLIQHKLSEFVHDLHRAAFPADAGIYKNVIAAAKHLDEEPDNEVSILDHRNGDLSLDSVLGTPSSGGGLVEQSVITGAIRISGIWHAVLKVVHRFSRAATAGTASGTLELVQNGLHPFILQALKQAISESIYEPAENASMSSEATYPDEDTDCPSFVRTILDEHSYEARQAKVDEFVYEGCLAIRNQGFDEHTTEILLEILHCYAEKSRHSDPQKSISQAEVARDIGLPRQTMNDYMKKLRAALEAIKS